MRNVAKLASIAAFTGIFLASSLAPAYALRVQGSAGTVEAEERQAASAYAEGGQGAATQEASILSPDEVRHIQWCAARYRLAYDAVNDTYARGGVSFQCVSPR